MKTRLGIALLIACLPWLAMAQNDDLYFVPKKEKKTEAKTEVRQVAKQTTTVTTTTASVSPGTTVVVKDVTGKTRDIDEYNRRYTSRENTFSVQNDTLYIEEKPYGERGEWVNGFEGSQDDYEYAMRIIRFRSPAYAIPISSPLYWDVVYGVYPSWDWNVYDDGLYAYVFPTFSNPLWWDWRWNWGVAGPRWGFSWSWHSPWYYSGWYSPYWYGGYWGGWYAGYWDAWHHPHPYWGGGGWHHPHYSYNNRRGEFGMPRRGGAYSQRRSMTNNSIRRATYDRNGRTGGRVVTGSRDAGSSVRGGRTSGYTRQSQLQRGGSGYTRPSSTRVNSYRNTNAYNRMNNNSNYNNFNRNNGNRGSYSSGSSFGGGRGNSSGGRVTRSVGGGGGARRR